MQSKNFAVFTLNIWTPKLLTILILKFERPFHYLLIHLKTAGWVANSVGTDQMLHSAASDLYLHCLLRYVCPNTDDMSKVVLDDWQTE